MSNQPTILIKKADGTQVRMTMGEFAIYKKTLNHPTTQPLDHSTTLPPNHPTTQPPDHPTTLPQKKDDEKEIENKNLPVVEGTTELTVDAPVKDIFVDEAAAKSRNQENNKAKNQTDSRPASQINENKKIVRIDDGFNEGDNEEVNKFIDMPALPDKKDEILDSILAKLSFQVAVELQLRLKSLVVSRMKDVRSDEQILEYAKREIAQGGLGLTEEQASELVERISEKEKSPIINHQLPDVDLKIERLKDYDSDLSQNPISKTQGIDNRATATSHVPMHDIIAPVRPVVEKLEATGPIDELNNFTLLDFRRLSAKPAQAVEILLEKINNLHQDSYEQFSLGLKAWYNSPLYQQYQNVIQRAVEENKKIEDILSTVSREELNKTEFEALAKGLESLNV